ncbi:hypothetical protein KR018_004827 [Drosophila ironensis]|nr:hypothetical protein KR018_004827 [Drosophila ironensis]
MFDRLTKINTSNAVRFPAQCIWLKLNGSWPNTTWRTKTLSVAYSIWAWYVIGSVGITICYQTGFLIKHLSDIILTTENCCTTFMGVLNFIRLFHLQLNQKQFRNLIKQFSQEIWIPRITHPTIAAECQKRMKTFSIMTGLLSCLIIMYCTMPLLELFLNTELNSDEKPFPYKMVFPYDPYSSWMTYFFTYLFTSYAGICVVTTLFAEDSIFGFFITYTCCQFQLLHENINNLLVTAKTRELIDDKERYMHQTRLKQIIKKHNSIISFAKRLEDFFSPILLINLLISSILICMVGFQIITGKNIFIGDYFKLIVYISSAISQLYILCENGDTLIRHSTLTAHQIYECHWENSYYAKSHIDAIISKQFRKQINFMILCSQKPVKITAFKFSTLSLQSFTTVCII